MSWFKRRTYEPAPVYEDPNLKTYEEIQVGQWVIIRSHDWYRVLAKEDHNRALVVKSFNDFWYNKDGYFPYVLDRPKIVAVDSCGVIYNDQPCLLYPGHHESWSHVNESRDKWKTI